MVTIWRHEHNKEFSKLLLSLNRGYCFLRIRLHTLYHYLMVKIYSTPWSVYCKMAKEYLQKNDVSFEEKDVSTDVEARNEMIEKSGQLGVPVIDVDGKITIGFDKPRLNELLNIK